MVTLIPFMLTMIGLSYVSVNGLRDWAERQRVLAIPNERSSHVRPTPSGGGAAIVGFSLLSLIVATLWSAYQEALPLSLTVLSYVGGAGAIAVISWFDDRYMLPNRWRIMVHSLSALVILCGIGSWQSVTLPLLGQVNLGWLGLPLSFVWLVGMTNVYNFMDGIDGLAGSQAVIAGVGWALFGWWIGQPFVLALGLGIAASSVGFLGHNWSPARIFMGDVGSAFLGFSFAVLPIVAAHHEPRLALAGLLLLWPFLFDAGFTLLRRLRHGENIFTAHRSHLYQRLVITGHSHRTVTLLYIGLALVGFLLALVWFVEVKGVAIALLSVLPLLALGLWLLVINQEQQPTSPAITALITTHQTNADPEVAISAPIGSLQR